MRLINTETVLLEDFTLCKIPQYAILSHTWTDEEVSFQEFTNRNSETTKKKGFAKILQTCKLAREDHIKYAWVDTCCIDKTSSAELSEAINSMFRWYQNAEVCYTYLLDLLPRKEAMDQKFVEYEELSSCRWFTRGWTLQELIAPKSVNFYDEFWTFRGSKDDLATLIHRITHIDSLILTGDKQPTRLSIVEKMSWAAKRETTRPEDTAYCLLGLFDVNMPLLYGEGNKAFLRLQQEIIKNNTDLSIFGWSYEEPVWCVRRDNPDCSVDCGHQSDTGRFSALASSPREFAAIGSWDILHSVEHSVTNRGIKIYCDLLQICLNGCDFRNCHCCPNSRKYALIIGYTAPECSLGIVLEKIEPDVFVRSRRHFICLNMTTLKTMLTRYRPIYLLAGDYTTSYVAQHLPHYFHLRIRKDTQLVIYSVMPGRRWDSCKRFWFIDFGSLYAWGIVSLNFSSRKTQGGISLLFLGRSRTVFIFDSSRYSKEIGLISQSSVDLTVRDVCRTFGIYRSGRDGLYPGSCETTFGDQKWKVYGKLIDRGASRWDLEVWTEESESMEGPSCAQPTLSGSSQSRSS